MACIDGSLTTALDVSTRYLSHSVALGYHDDLLPFHLSPSTAISPFHGSNKMSLTCANEAFLPFPKTLTTFSLLPPGVTRSCRDKVTSDCDDQTETSSIEQSSKVPGPRALAFHRSASTADLQVGKSMQNFESSRVDLRRTPQSTYDLRACAQHKEQNDRYGECLHAYSGQDTHLQPWPSKPDDQTEYEQRRLRRKFQYKSYQDLHILSMYQENGSLLSLNSIRQPQSATIESSSEASGSTESSPQSSPRPRTPADDPITDRTFWARDDEVGKHRLRRSDARQVHVIEHDIDNDEGENEIVQSPPNFVGFLADIHSDASNRAYWARQT